MTVKAPIPRKYRKSEAVSFTPRAFSSRSANGSSTAPPTSTRSAVSCMGANAPASSLSATSVVE